MGRSLLLDAQSPGNRISPEIILSGRRLNDSMGEYVALQLVKAMLEGYNIKRVSRPYIGITFKENCPDLRNSKVIDVINELETYGIDVDCCDPWCDPKEAEAHYSISLVSQPVPFTYDSVIVAVAHEQFIEWGIQKIRKFCKPNSVIYDLKYVLPKASVELRL